MSNAFGPGSNWRNDKGFIAGREEKSLFSILSTDGDGAAGFPDTLPGVNVLKNDGDGNLVWIRSGYSLITNGGESNALIEMSMPVVDGSIHTTVKGNPIMEVRPENTRTSHTNVDVVVTGGIGISETCYFNKTLSIAAATASTNTVTGALVVTGGVACAGALNVDTLNITSTTDSWGASTGALQILGGLGIAGNIFASYVDSQVFIVTDVGGNLKTYIDKAVSGTNWRQPVRASYDAAHSIVAGEGEGAGLIIGQPGGSIVADGVTLVTGDRILMTGMTSGTPAGVHNGIWVVDTAYYWNRPDDYKATGLNPTFAAATVVVNEGAFYGDKAFMCTTNKGSDTIGTHASTWIQFLGGSSLSINAAETSMSLFATVPDIGITNANRETMRLHAGSADPLNGSSDDWFTCNIDGGLGSGVHAKAVGANSLPLIIESTDRTECDIRLALGWFVGQNKAAIQHRNTTGLAADNVLALRIQDYTLGLTMNEAAVEDRITLSHTNTTLAGARSSTLIELGTHNARASRITCDALGTKFHMGSTAPLADGETIAMNERWWNVNGVTLTGGGFDASPTFMYALGAAGVGSFGSNSTTIRDYEQDLFWYKQKPDHSTDRSKDREIAISGSFNSQSQGSVFSTDRGAKYLFGGRIEYTAESESGGSEEVIVFLRKVTGNVTVYQWSNHMGYHDGSTSTYNQLILRGIVDLEANVNYKLVIWGRHVDGGGGSFSIHHSCVFAKLFGQRWPVTVTE